MPLLMTNEMMQSSLLEISVQFSILLDRPLKTVINWYYSIDFRGLSQNLVLRSLSGSNLSGTHLLRLWGICTWGVLCISMPAKAPVETLALFAPVPLYQKMRCDTFCIEHCFILIILMSQIPHYQKVSVRSFHMILLSLKWGYEKKRSASRTTSYFLWYTYLLTLFWIISLHI